jgi:TolB protein
LSSRFILGYTLLGVFLVMRRILLLSALVSVLSFSRGAAAQTDLYVRGAGKLIPIAAPTLCGVAADSGSAAEIPSVVRKDLDISGFFEVQNPASYIESGERCVSPEGTAFTDWSVLGTEGLIKGRVQVIDNRIVAQLYLLDVQKQQIVLAREYAGDLNQSRMIAHKFANEVMKHYTGEAGVFGSQIAFSSRIGRFKELFVMEMDGSNMRQLTSEKGLAMSSAWDPSGTRLVYTSYRNRTPDLFILDVATKASRQLTKTSELEIGSHFLNDSQVLTSRTEGSDSDIILLSGDGKVLRRLTPANRAIDVSPVPSPDGSQIAFCSNRGGGPQIYMMGASGESPRRVSFVTSNYCTSPAWSPKGDKIAFVCRADGDFQMFLSDPDGSNAVQLTSSGSSEDPEFSPDGRYLVFSTTYFGGGYSIAIMRTDGTSIKQVTKGRGGDFEPAWGPMPR